MRRLVLSLIIVLLSCVFAHGQSHLGLSEATIYKSFKEGAGTYIDTKYSYEGNVKNTKIICKTNSGRYYYYLVDDVCVRVLIIPQEKFLYEFTDLYNEEMIEVKKNRWKTVIAGLEINVKMTYLAPFRYVFVCWIGDYEFREVKV